MRSASRRLSKLMSLSVVLLTSLPTGQTTVVVADSRLAQTAPVPTEAATTATLPSIRRSLVYVAPDPKPIAAPPPTSLEPTVAPSVAPYSVAPSIHSSLAPTVMPTQKDKSWTLDNVLDGNVEMKSLFGGSSLSSSKKSAMGAATVAVISAFLSLVLFL